MSLSRLINILKNYNASDLEEEAKKIQPVAGLSPNEAWELEKLEDNPRDFFTFHKEMTSQSIEIEK